MKRNVGERERYVRLALGAAAALAAAKTTGWQRSLWGGLAAMEITTGLTQYCPVSQALGIDTYDRDLLGEGERNTEIVERTHVAGSLGLEPSTVADTPPVTPETSVFQQQSPAV